MEEIVQEVELDYKPRDVFLDFHERKQRWAVIVAHRRCGKTVSCINELIYKALIEGKEDGRYAYVAPYYSQAKNIAWDYLLRFSKPVMAKANQSELWVELINGSRIRLFGADNADSLRGLYLDGIVLDEYADMRPRIWGEIIRPLLADRLGWAVFIGTPKGHNAFWDIYNNATKSPDWYAKTLRADQTNLLPQSELDDARLQMTPDQYEQEFMCSFDAAILGAIYGIEMRQLTDQGRITKVDYDPLFKCHTSWDIGARDDTSIWWWQIVHGEIRMLDFHSSNGQPIAYYTGLIQSKQQEYGYDYGTHWLPHDARAKTFASNGKSSIEQILAKIPQENVKITPNLGLQDGIQASRLALLRTWFDADKCSDGIECLRQYQREYDEDKKMFRNTPKHDWTSHGSDAFRYMAVVWQEETKALTKETPILGLGVGENHATLNDLWKSSPTKTVRRI